MSKRRIVEISLDSLQLVIPSLSGRAASKHLVLVTLLWPRAAIARKVSSQVVELADGCGVLKDAPWTSRILFKEIVQGRFGIAASVSEPMSDAAIARVVQGIGATVYEMAGDIGSDALAGGPGVVAVRHLLKGLGKAATSAGETPRNVAEGSLDLEIGTSWKSGRARTVAVPLAVPQALYRVSRSRQGRELTSRRRKIADAGTQNGELKLSVKAYE